MLVKQGIHPAHVRKEIKKRNVEALEERKRAKESSFAKVSPALPLSRRDPSFKRAKESSFAKVSAAYFAEVKRSELPADAALT